MTTCKTTIPKFVQYSEFTQLAWYNAVNTLDFDFTWESGNGWILTFSDYRELFIFKQMFDL